MISLIIQNKIVYKVYLFLGIFISNYCYSDIPFSAEEWQSYVLTKMNQITSYQLTYQGFINVPPSPDDKDAKEQIDQFKNILEKRKSGQLTDNEKKDWSSWTDADLEKSIRDHEQILNGLRIENTVVFSTNGNRKRQDYFRDNVEPKHYYDLFDGKEAYRCNIGSDVVKGAFYAGKWLSPIFDNGYGINIGMYIQNGFTIGKYDSVNCKIQVQSDVYMRPEEIFEFTLLESHYEYWKECDVLNKKGIREKAICENFKEFSSIMIPQVVKVQRKTKGTWYDYMSLTLVDAKTNNVDFPEGFFSPSKDENVKITEVGR